MRVELHNIPIREVVAGYEDNAEEGVKGYNGLLDIRPPYQREFVYDAAQRNAVIDSVLKGLPLNIMYWAKHDDDTFEILDGQQRTISICQYVSGMFQVNAMNFANLGEETQSRILDYELMIYQCSGSHTELLEWFKTVNIAGEPLTEQELRNAVYTGPWLSDAKRRFSRRSCAAYQLGGAYVKGSPIRQELLELAIKWATKENQPNDMHIRSYMATHQHRQNANSLWNYFKKVIRWVQTVFTEYRKEMKGLPWNEMYEAHKNDTLDAEELEDRISVLMADEDVTNKRGIYAYVLTGEVKHLNIRAFDKKQRRTMYEKQSGQCAQCDKECDLAEMHADHITPWSQGGKTDTNNGRMLCADCNRRKGAQ